MTESGSSRDRVGDDDETWKHTANRPRWTKKGTSSGQAGGNAGREDEDKYGSPRDSFI